MRAALVLSSPACVLRSYQPAQVQRAPLAARPAVRRHTVRVAAGSDRFDERPADPVPQEQRQISALLMQDMQQKIGEALETKDVRVTDAYGDGRHVSIDVVSPLFDGKSSVARQRLVYKAIWLELQNAVHAVDAMTTKTPAEAAAQ